MQRLLTWIEFKATKLVDFWYFKDDLNHLQPRDYTWYENVVWHIGYYAGRLAEYRK